MKFVKKTDQVFCLRLETAAFLQGWFGVVSSLSSLILTSATIRKMSMIAQREELEASCCK